MKTKSNNKTRLIIYGVIFVAIYILVYSFFQSKQVSKEQIQELVEPFGIYGLLILFLIQIPFTITPFPDGVMPLVGMVMYGPVGVFAVSLAMLVGAIINFSIGKRLGKGYILHKFPEVKSSLEKLGNKNVVIRLMAMRMFTFVSFDITSYIAGISNIKFKDFIVSVVFSLFPINVILILVGSGLFAKTAQEIITIGGLLIIVVTLLFIFYKKSRIK